MVFEVTFPCRPSASSFTLHGWARGEVWLKMAEDFLQSHKKAEPMPKVIRDVKSFFSEVSQISS